LTPKFNLTTFFRWAKLNQDKSLNIRGEAKMPSGWDVYYVVFLSAVLALAIPGGLKLVSFFAGNRKQHAEEHARATEAPSLGRRINTRFFLSANAMLIVITLALLLIPCVGALRLGIEKRDSHGSLIAIVSVAGFSALGLLYSGRKGDLSWLKSFRRHKDDPNE
jgi:hypothetical protein